MFWMDWRELEKHNDWGVRDKDDDTAAMWNDGADMWEERSRQETAFAQRQVDALYRVTPETTVLDVCCGTGPLTIPLSQKAKRVTAFDFNEKMLEFVRNKAEAAGSHNVDFLKGNFNSIVPGKDFQPAEIAVTRHSPAQGNILRYSRFATKYCYSLALISDGKAEILRPGSKNGGRWIRSTHRDVNETPRLDVRKYGLGVTFNLLYESGANPELYYVMDEKTHTAATQEELAKLVFPVGEGPEILDFVKRRAERAGDGWKLTLHQKMSVMGWDPTEIDWDMLASLGVDW